MAARPVGQDDEIHLLDLLIVLAKHKKLILRNTFGAALVAVVVSSMMPKIYTASTSIMPPGQGQSSAMLGQLGGLMGGAALGIKNPSDLYIGMLKSRSVEDAMVKRFNLKALYESKTDEDARKSLEGGMIASAGKDGIISISFDDKDPKRAADIANAYVEELNRLTATLAITEASQRRLFFEKQLNLVRENLAKAEFDLQKMQERTGLIRDYPQEQEIAATNARLRAEIAAKEVQLSAMQIGVTSRNPEYLRLQQELISLKERLKGEGAGDDPNDGMSEKGLEYIRKFREVKYNQAVMDMLYKQFEAAKVDEAKDTPVIQVLDKAVPPERKSKPRRAIIVILVTLSVFFFSILWAFFREAAERAKADPAQAEKYAMLRKSLSFRK
ncbi:MAG: lipopolysaccharide biosynthesis protein [Burkholderiales bacterium]|nr:lipopolysaccharide biosynthesis protein [Burkholderiales bacterium]